MSKDNPVFVYGAVYADRDDADADYDTLLDLHSADLVGTYDVALVYKDDDGKVHVTKHEKPTQHGAWTGAAVGDWWGSSSRRRFSARRSSAPRRAGGSGMPWVACRAAMPRSSARPQRRPGRAGSDRGVAPSGAARQGAHARGEDPREGNQRGRQGAREGTRRDPRLISDPFSPATLAPPSWRRESAPVPSTYDGELLSQVAGSPPLAIAIAGASLGGKTHARQTQDQRRPETYLEGGEVDDFSLDCVGHYLRGMLDLFRTDNVPARGTTGCSGSDSSSRSCGSLAR